MIKFFRDIINETNLKGISIKFTEIRVDFFSNDINGYSKIEEIYKSIWNLSNLKKYENNSAVWKIVSLKSNLYYDWIQNNNLDFKEKILYDGIDGKEAKLRNYVIILHKDLNTGITIIDYKTKEILYIYDELDFIHLEHLIKQPFVVYCKIKGFIGIHCSACEYNGQGIMFVGDKGKGKSTILMHLLREGALYLGNDTVRALSDKEGKLYMYQWPTQIRLGNGTVEDIDVLHEFIKKNTNDVTVGEDGKIEFYTPLLSNIFDKTISISKSILDILIFPEFCLENEECILKSISKDEAIKKILEIHKIKRKKMSWLDLEKEDLLHEKELYNLNNFIENIPNEIYIYQFGVSNVEPAKNLINLLENEKRII